ncbi:serine hydrolase domain-containing protein [Gordonia neofelifaecis]|nr:serine hydrolase domain-containing protein [Gordonia neofelifaecis]
MGGSKGASRGARSVVLLVVAALSAALLVGCGTSTEEAAPTVSVSRPAAPTGALAPALQAKLRAALDVTMKQYEVPGAAVGVWIPGQGSWTTAAGLADVTKKVPVTTSMSWPLRSVTKSYTVTLLLQLVDQGEVGLDDSLGKYVQGVTNGDEITLRQLANMSSGNADYVGEAFLKEFGKDPDKIFTLDELNAFVLNQPAQFAPGTRKVYTNADTNLLGAVIEQVTGQQFADVLSDRILAPVKLSGTHYLLDVTKWTAPHPTGYIQGDGGPEAQPDNLSIYGPSGSMVSTLDDARVWGTTLAEGLLLTPATQAQRERGAPLQVGPPYDIYALGMGRTDGWWGHNGEGLGFTAAVFHDPASGATIAVFMNVSNAPDKAHPADQTFRRFAEILKSEAAT